MSLIPVCLLFCTLGLKGTDYFNKSVSRHKKKLPITKSKIEKEPRLQAYKAGIYIFKSNIIWGAGPNTFGFESLPYIESYGFRNKIFRSPHNLIVKVMAEYGLFGLFIALFLVSIFAIKMRENIKSFSKKASLSIYLLFISLSIEFMFQFPLDTLTSYPFIGIAIAPAFCTFKKSKFTQLDLKIIGLITFLCFLMQFSKYYHAKELAKTNLSLACEAYPAHWKYCTSARIPKPEAVMKALRESPLNVFLLHRSKNIKLKELNSEYKNICLRDFLKNQENCSYIQKRIKEEIYNSK